MVQGCRLLPCSCTVLLCSHRSLSVVLPCVAWSSRSLQSTGRLCLTASTHVFLSAPLCLSSYSPGLLLVLQTLGASQPSHGHGGSWLWLGMGFGHIWGKWMEASGVDARQRVLGLRVAGVWCAECGHPSRSALIMKKNIFGPMPKKPKLFYLTLWSKAYLEYSSNHEILPPSNPGLKQAASNSLSRTFPFCLVTCLLPHLNTICFCEVSYWR